MRLDRGPDKAHLGRLEVRVREHAVVVVGRCGLGVRGGVVLRAFGPAAALGCGARFGGGEGVRWGV